MKQEYTTAELAAQVAALERLFDSVTLVDPAAQRVLDSRTLQPTETPCRRLPPLDSTGRAWSLVRTGDGMETALCQAITVDGRGCVLVAGYTGAELGEADRDRSDRAFTRLTGQYMDDLHHDYVTGVYNRRYLDEEFLPRMREKVNAGATFAAALVRVNEYGAVLAQEGHAAADRGLLVAAGILQKAGVDPENGVIARLDGGMFLVGEMNAAADSLRGRIIDTSNNSRRVFGYSLSRRGEFTLSVGAAEWAETRSWDMLLALAEQRIARG